MELDRRELQAALAAAYPWLEDPDVGPRAVDAGECDRCGRHPRFVPTCGPTSVEAVCPVCATEAGISLWCEGHAGTGRSVLAALSSLPEEWDVATRLWWVATGEVRLDTLVLPPAARLPAGVRAALGG